MLYLLAVSIGLLTNLAFPYFNFWYILFFIFPLLYLLGHVWSKSFKQRILLGFLFGFSFVLGGFYWIYNAIYISTGSVVLSALAVVGKSIVIGSFYSFLFIFKDFLKNKSHFLYAFLMLVMHMAITYLKTAIVPWYYLPVIFSENLVFIQFLRFININIANFILSAIFLTPVIIYFNRTLKQTILTVGLIVAILAVMYVDGFLYMKDKKIALNTKNNDIFVKMVQVNVNQFEKARGINVLERYKETISLAFSDLPETSNTTIIILPESAVNGAISNNNDFVVQDISKRLKQNQYIITGALRKDNEGNFFNSLFVIGKDGILNYYDKYHLVPVGEYIPFLSKSVVGSYGFKRGDGYKNLSVENIKFLPLICYEVGFLGAKKDYEDINFIVNITNDAWYGKTTQPYHHLAIASIHAISSGKTIFRVSNNGISAVLNKHGVAVIKTHLYTKDSVLIKLSI